MIKVKVTDIVPLRDLVLIVGLWSFVVLAAGVVFITTGHVVHSLVTCDCHGRHKPTWNNNPKLPPRAYPEAPHER